MAAGRGTFGFCVEAAAMPFGLSPRTGTLRAESPLWGAGHVRDRDAGALKPLPPPPSSAGRGGWVPEPALIFFSVSSKSLCGLSRPSQAWLEAALRPSVRAHPSSPRRLIPASLSPSVATGLRFCVGPSQQEAEAAVGSFPRPLNSSSRVWSDRSLADPNSVDGLWVACTVLVLDAVRGGGGVCLPSSFGLFKVSGLGGWYGECSDNIAS